MFQLKDDEREEFRASFVRYVKPCLVVFTRESAVERVLEFVARYRLYILRSLNFEPSEIGNFFHQS